MLKLSAILLLVVVACATADLLQDDKGVLKVSNFASKYLNDRNYSPFHHRLVKIARAYTERDEDGDLYYHLDIILGMTNCKKQDMSYDEASDCDIQDSESAYKRCLVKVRDEDKNGDYQFNISVCKVLSKKDL